MLDVQPAGLVAVGDKVSVLRLRTEGWSPSARKLVGPDSSSGGHLANAGLPVSGCQQHQVATVRHQTGERVMVFGPREAYAKLQQDVVQCRRRLAALDCRVTSCLDVPSDCA